MEFKTSYIFLASLLLSIHLMAQPNIIPAPAQSESILLSNATVHIGNGQLLENAAVGFVDGKINFVGKVDQASSTDYQNVIDVTGKHIYPGLIAPNNQLGLIEIGAVGATVDASEIGSQNSHMQSRVAFNTDSQILPTIRSMGILLSEPVIKSGSIMGNSSIMHLDGWNWEDATYKADVGLHIQWPNRYEQTGWWAEPGPIKKINTYQDKVVELKAFFKEAKAYATKENLDNPILRFESIRDLFDGRKKIFIHEDFAPSIIEAVLFAEELGIKPVIVGGHDAYLIIDFLKEHQVPIVLHTTQALPKREDEPVDINFKLPAILAQADMLFAFGMEGFWEVRNLAFQAGQAVGYGLDKEKALQALTENPAKIFDIADRTGTLAVGKDANIVVSQGDLLDIRTARVESAFIQGRAIDLNNKQKDLYKKYSEKYRRAEK